jgi:hypothetical protein
MLSFLMLSFPMVSFPMVSLSNHEPRTTNYEPRGPGAPNQQSASLSLVRERVPEGRVRGAPCAESLTISVV